VKLTETFNYAYPETQKWAFSNDSDYTNSIQNAVSRLYGGATNDILGVQNLIATPANVPAQAVKENVSNGHSSGPAQKPIVEQDAPTQDIPLTLHSQHAEHHHVRDILDKAKGIFGHHPAEGGESARGLDLEAEIGKGELILSLPSPLLGTQPVSIANTLQLQHSPFRPQKPAAILNISATSKYPNTFSTKPSESTSSSGILTGQRTPGTPKTHSSAPWLSSGATPSPPAAGNALQTPSVT
jgi:hypothetical protein